MKTKICFKCGKEKEIKEFYKHPRMNDGHLNKCKDCTKKDVTQNYYDKRPDTEWREKERIRHKDKYKRLNYREKQKVWNKKRPWSNNAKYKNICRKYRNILKDNEILHHWSYKDEHMESIFVIDKDFHGYIHRFLTITSDRNFIGKFPNGSKQLLDSKEKHEKFLTLHAAEYRKLYNIKTLSHD